MGKQPVGLEYHLLVEIKSMSIAKGQMSPSDIIKYVDVDICVQTPYGFERASALLFSKLRAVGRTEIWKSELGV